jgi:DnaJ-class molecular chaperone
MERDYYQVLGIGPDADEKEIKKAYRTIIRYCHPDSPDCRMTKDELLEVQEAYETLADPEKRARYDRRRSVSSSGRSGRAGAGNAARQTAVRNSFFEDDAFPDPFSFFRDPFSDSPFARTGERGFMSERELEIMLTRAEARRGGTFEITVPGPGGIPAGTIAVRIPPGVRSGSETVVDLGEAIGIRQRVRITVVIDGSSG